MIYLSAMKRLLTTLLLICVFSCQPTASKKHVILPEWMKGEFTDDYEIGYTINDSMFIMKNAAIYHIIDYNPAAAYILAQNDSGNKSDKGLFTRIDFMTLSNMQSFKWAYCFQVYNAISKEAAIQAARADTLNPKKGCNGYPFSRMRRSDGTDTIRRSY